MIVIMYLGTCPLYKWLYMCTEYFKDFFKKISKNPYGFVITNQLLVKLTKGVREYRSI